MFETPEEIKELQALLDRSYEAGGSHLLSIHTDNWRLSAEQIVERLQGMCVLNLATVNSRGEPMVGPVDGFLYRGRFVFGSSPESMRAKHIRRNPAVSVAHTVGEELAVVVHGKAVELDKMSERGLGFRDLGISIYGQEHVDQYWDGGAPYWEVEPRRMFALAPVVEEGS
jgi:nitroimidazol reductase NimA-like FMN-containing flavoprotein (pyridoxamine 5'-phosphate oxidase superfamily)